MRIKVDGAAIPAHRLAIFLVTGAWPNSQVDHINGNKLDNRFCNLRDVSPAVNSQNARKPTVKNKSGVLGVSWHPTSKKWRADIGIEGKSVYLGLFATKDAAHAAYLNAKRRSHPGCTI